MIMRQDILLASFLILFLSSTVVALVVVALNSSSITTLSIPFTSTSVPATIISSSPFTADNSTFVKNTAIKSTAKPPNRPNGETDTRWPSDRLISSKPSAQAIFPNLVVPPPPPQKSRHESPKIKKINKRECKPNCATAIERLLFVDSMTQFQLARMRRDPPELEWILHGCRHGTVDRPSSSSSSGGFGFNFLPSCQRHDFGVRNYRPGNLWGSRAKRAVDENLRKDLMRECERYDDDEDGNRNGKEGEGEEKEKEKGESELPRGDECRRTATIYYNMVRKDEQTMA